MPAGLIVPLPISQPRFSGESTLGAWRFIFITLARRDGDLFPNARVPSESLTEIPAVEGQQLAVVEGGHVRGTGFTADQRHFPKEDFPNPG